MRFRCAALALVLSFSFAASARAGLVRVRFEGTVTETCLQVFCSTNESPVEIGSTVIGFLRYSTDLPPSDSSLPVDAMSYGPAGIDFSISFAGETLRSETTYLAVGAHVFFVSSSKEPVLRTRLNADAVSWSLGRAFGEFPDPIFDGPEPPTTAEVLALGEQPLFIGPQECVDPPDCEIFRADFRWRIAAAVTFRAPEASVSFLMATALLSCAGARRRFGS